MENKSNQVLIRRAGTKKCLPPSHKDTKDICNRSRVQGSKVQRLRVERFNVERRTQNAEPRTVNLGALWREEKSFATKSTKINTKCLMVKGIMK